MSNFRIKQVSEREFWIERKIFKTKRGGFMCLKKIQEECWERTAIDNIESLGIYSYPRFKKFSSLEDAREWIYREVKYPIYHSAESDLPGRDYECLETK